MNRNVNETMDGIINTLINFVSEDDKSRIANVKRRHIRATENDEPIVEFVKKVEVKTYKIYNDSFSLFFYSDERYLFFSQQYESSIYDLGLIPCADLTITLGCSMICISMNALKLKNTTTSLDIINMCLGIEAQNDKGDAVIEYDNIKELFDPFCVVQVNSCFNLTYIEDIYRIYAYILSCTDKEYIEGINTKIQELALLESSRSIALSLINFYKSSIDEYSFLQLYQCVEYLFKINNSIIISKKLNIDNKEVIDIISHYDLKKAEKDSLIDVLKESEETYITNFYNIIATEKHDEDNPTKIAAEYIYKLRCNVAHLRYDQNNLSNKYEWNSIFSALLDIIISIYEKLNGTILEICMHKSTWKTIS